MALRTGQELHPESSSSSASWWRWAWPTKTASPTPASSILPTTRSIAIRARCAPAAFSKTLKEYLTPGLFVRVRIPFGKPHQSLLVNERVIGTDQREKYLLTVNKGDVVEYRRVTVGRLLDGLRVIETGLKPDELVIVSGLLRARPCAKVQPKAAASNVAAQSSLPPQPPPVIPPKPRPTNVLVSH